MCFMIPEMWLFQPGLCSSHCGISDVQVQPQNLCYRHRVRWALPQPWSCSRGHTQRGLWVAKLSPLCACCPPLLCCT